MNRIRASIVFCLLILLLHLRLNFWTFSFTAFFLKSNSPTNPFNILTGDITIKSTHYNLETLESIQKDCGQLCNTSRAGIPGKYFSNVNAIVDCRAIFNNRYIDLGHNLPKAPRKIPDYLLHEFTMNGKMTLSYDYYDQKYLNKTIGKPVWTFNLIDEWVKLAKIGLLSGNYGKEETNALRNGLKRAPGIFNGRVLVIGSEIPWVEACVLEAGARNVVTLEYGAIISEHSQVKSMLPSEFRMLFLNNTLGEFDAVVTFSSVEHSGLGRYGDRLNPWGDILSISRAWCVTRTGGSLTIGVPYDFYNDKLIFNAHRIYGQKRYPYLVTNWQQHYRGDGRHRVHVFIKNNNQINS